MSGSIVRMETIFSKRNTVNIAFVSLLFCIVIITFRLVLHADFVMWDDDVIIYGNKSLGGLSLQRLYWVFTDVNSMMRYNPLALLSWVITYTFWGLNPFPYHLGNLLLHAVSATTLFFIIVKILSQLTENTNKWYDSYQVLPIISFLCALVWAIHPLRVEPVAWATDRTYCLATCFIFISFLFYVMANDREITSANKKKYIVFSIIFYILSLLSYAIGMTYFLVLLILDVFLYKKIRREHSLTDICKNVLFEKIIFAVPAILIAVISIKVVTAGAGVWDPSVPLSEFGLFARISQAMHVVTYYLYRPFIPVNLSPVYLTLVQFNPLSIPFIISSMVVVISFALLIMFWKEHPLLASFFLCHVVLLIPVMGFFEYPHYTVDRYSILTSACFSVFLGIALSSINKKQTRRILFVAFSCVLIVLGELSYTQTKVWANSETLFNHMIKQMGDDPYKEDILLRLGRYQSKVGKIEEAVNTLRKALAINPYSVQGNESLGELSIEIKDYSQSLACYSRLTELFPDNFKYNYQREKARNALKASPGK